MDYKQPEENNNLDLTNKTISWDGIQNKPDRNHSNMGSVAMSSPESNLVVPESYTPEIGKIVDNEPSKVSVADQAEQAIDNVIIFNKDLIGAGNTKEKNISKSTLGEVHKLKLKFNQTSNCDQFYKNIREGVSPVYWKHAWNRDFGEGKKAA